MKKDIEIPNVYGVYIAIVNEFDNEGEKLWNAYIVNDNDTPVDNVIISSKGYHKNINGEEFKSSTLRHFYKSVDSKSFQKIEIIIDDLLMLNNEYFVSYYQNNKLFDKRFVFPSETIKKEYLSEVPVIKKLGVWIK